MYHFLKKKKKSGMWQWHCRNRREKKLQLVCGNAITEIGWKKICGNCGNAIAKNGREKKIVVAEIWGGIKKKKSAMSTIFL